MRRICTKSRLWSHYKDIQRSSMTQGGKRQPFPWVHRNRQFSASVSGQGNPLTDEEFAQLLVDGGHYPSPAQQHKALVAVSGGPDSIALALMLHRFSSVAALQPVAVTIDHRFRRESKAEADYVHRILTGWGMEHHVLRVDWDGRFPVTSKKQLRGREVRFEALSAFSKDMQIGDCYFGHHLDDQLETCFLRLARNSGLCGLSGMQSVTYMKSLRAHRPLLSIPKYRLRDTCQQLGVNPVEDPTNDNMSYDRTRVRKFLTQWKGSVLSDITMSSLLKFPSSFNDIVSRLQNQVIERCTCLASHLGYMVIDATELDARNIPINIRVEALCDILIAVSGKGKKLRRVQAMNFLHQLSGLRTRWSIGGCLVVPYSKKSINNPLNSDIQYTPNNRLFVICKETTSKEVPANISMPMKRQPTPDGYTTLKQKKGNAERESNVSSYKSTYISELLNWDNRLNIWCQYDAEDECCQANSLPSELQGLYVRLASFREWEMLLRYRPDIPSTLCVPLRDVVWSIPVAFVERRYFSLTSREVGKMHRKCRRPYDPDKSLMGDTESIVAVPFTGDALFTGLRMYTSFREDLVGLKSDQKFA